MNPNQQFRGRVVGGPQSQKPGRKLDIEQKLFTSNEQTVPIRILKGQDRIAGVHIFPVFNITKVESDEGGGK